MKIQYDSKKEKKYSGMIDRMLEKPYCLIDIYPVLVPEGSRGNYFKINDWILDHEYEELGRRFFNILLKLNCYCDLTLYFGRHLKKNPSPDLLFKWVMKCFSAKQNKRKYMNIFIDQDRAMLVLDGDNTYMPAYLSAYEEDEELRELLHKLAASEGMFFR